MLMQIILVRYCKPLLGQLNFNIGLILGQDCNVVWVPLLRSCFGNNLPCILNVNKSTGTLKCHANLHFPVRKYNSSCCGLKSIRYSFFFFFFLFVGILASLIFNQNVEMLSCLQLSKSSLDLRYCHVKLPATQRVIILKQNVEMPSCLQLSMSSFSNKMLRCRVDSNSASRHVETKCWDT